MHILLVKVQQKIMDDKVDELIDHLGAGLELANLQLTAGRATSMPVKHLVKAFGLMLEIIALQKDFPAYFKELPKEAELLLEGNDLPADKHFTVYERLKEILLDTTNHCDGSGKYIGAFNHHFSLKRPFFEAYIILWQKLCVNELDPSPRILERLAYGTLNLLDLLVEERLLHKAIYPLTADDENLLVRYNQNRVLRIDEMLMEGSFVADTTVLDHNSRRIPCLKCGSYNMLRGYTDERENIKQFVATGYQCTQCGMELFDQKDILLAGIKPVYSLPR